MKKLSLFLASLLYGDTYYDGLSYLNKIRTDTGLNSLIQSNILDTSAQAHAEYLVKNSIVGHYQSESKPYFTGVTPSDRAQYAGYKYSVSENIAFGSDSYIESIDNLMSAIYHRFGFLDFNIDEVGFAKVESSNYYYKNAYVYNMGNSYMNFVCSSGGDYANDGSYYSPCSDTKLKVKLDSMSYIASSNPTYVIYPVENQNNFVPVFYEESPDPLPDLSVSGNPISINFNSAKIKTVELESFTLKNAEGKTVDSRILSSTTDPNGHLSEFEYALFPLKRLDWSSYYNVEFKAKVDGTSFSKSWMFRTENLAYPQIVLDKNSDILGVAPNTEYAISVSQDLIDKFSSYSMTYTDGCYIDLIDFNTLKVKVSSGYCKVKLDSKITFTLDSSKTPTISTPLQEDNGSVALYLQSGWNLVATPVNKSLTKNELGGTIWTFSNNRWNLPTSVNPKEGFWLYLDKKNTLELNGDKYSVEIKDSNSWSLLGTGEDINMSNYSNKLYWTYSNGNWEYKPKTIKRGQGFWIINNMF